MDELMEMVDSIKGSHEAPKAIEITSSITAARLGACFHTGLLRRFIHFNGSVSMT